MTDLNAHPGRLALAMFAATLDALDVIHQHTGLGGDDAPAVLAAIRAIIERVRAGFEGKVDPEAIMRELTLLKDKLAANDAHADAELIKRFGNREALGIKP